MHHIGSMTKNSKYKKNQNSFGGQERQVLFEASLLYHSKVNTIWPFGFGILRP